MAHGVVVACAQAFRVYEELRALFGHNEFAGRSVIELQADLLFEPPQRLRECRL